MLASVLANNPALCQAMVRQVERELRVGPIGRGGAAPLAQCDPEAVPRRLKAGAARRRSSRRLSRSDPEAVP